MSGDSGDEGRERRRSAEFRALPSREAQTRRIVAARLRYWGLGALVGDAVLGLDGLLAQARRGGAGSEAGVQAAAPADTDRTIGAAGAAPGGCPSPGNGEPRLVRAELTRGLLTLSVRVRGDRPPPRPLARPADGEPAADGGEFGSARGEGPAPAVGVSESGGMRVYGDGGGTEVWCTLRVPASAGAPAGTGPDVGTGTGAEAGADGGRDAGTGRVPGTLRDTGPGRDTAPAPRTEEAPAGEGAALPG